MVESLPNRLLDIGLSIQNTLGRNFLPRNNSWHFYTLLKYSEHAPTIRETRPNRL